MSLPLPDPNVEFISGHREPFVSYDAEQMQACREAALEEAAQAAEKVDLYLRCFLKHSDPRMTCAQAIRSLKS